VTVDRFNQILSRLDDFERRLSSVSDNVQIKSRIPDEPNAFVAMAIEKHVEKYSKEIEFRLTVLIQIINN